MMAAVQIFMSGDAKSQNSGAGGGGGEADPAVWFPHGRTWCATAVSHPGRDPAGLFCSYVTQRQDVISAGKDLLKEGLNNLCWKATGGHEE